MSEIDPACHCGHPMSDHDPYTESCRQCRCAQFASKHPAVEVLEALEARLKASVDLASKPDPAYWLGWIEEVRRAKGV